MTESAVPSGDIWASTARITGVASIGAAGGFVWMARGPVAPGLGKAAFWIGLVYVTWTAINTAPDQLIEAAKAHLIVVVAAMAVWSVVVTQLSLPSQPAEALATPMLSALVTATFVFPAAAAAVVVSTAVVKAASTVVGSTAVGAEP